MDESQEINAYVEQLRAEHRRLHELLRRIQQEWPQVEQPIPTAEACSRTVVSLERLRDELASHFQQEEEGGCLEEAVSRCPRLGGEADRIEHEHPPLLAELDEVVAGLRGNTSDTVSSSASYERFDRFTRKLHAHEAAENRLLEEAFGVEDD